MDCQRLGGGARFSAAAAVEPIETSPAVARRARLAAPEALEATVLAARRQERGFRGGGGGEASSSASSAFVAAAVGRPATRATATSSPRPSAEDSPLSPLLSPPLPLATSAKARETSAAPRAPTAAPTAAAAAA